MIVYKITNNHDSKIYVGQTKQSIEKRFIQHRYEPTLLGEAIRQYGLENFTIEILEECDNQKQLNEREKFWINTFKCKYPNGYNLTCGGEGGIKNCEINFKLSVTSTLKKQLEDLASVDEISMNALIEKICLAYVQCRADDLSELDSFRARIREKNSSTPADEST